MDVHVAVCFDTLDGTLAHHASAGELYCGERCLVGQQRGAQTDGGAFRHGDAHGGGAGAGDGHPAQPGDYDVVGGFLPAVPSDLWKYKTIKFILNKDKTKTKRNRYINNFYFTRANQL